MKVPAKLMWGLGRLVPTWLAGAVMAWLNDLKIVGAVLLLVAVASAWGNRRMLQDIEDVMSRRLAIESSETQGIASSPVELLAFLVPIGDLFGPGFGWAVTLGTLVAAAAVLQLVKPEPPALLMFTFGYRPHTVTLAAGDVTLWLTGKRLLSPGDAVIAAEPSQRLWIGRIDDV